MSLAATLTGRRLGVYHVQSLLGVGGMGEVYRARDTRLERDVAIKILPHDLADDADRLARFDREARVLASLNHPHIGAIYGFEDSTTSDGLRVRGLVLELVEGDTLADRLATGAMTPAAVMPIARQIAQALDAAHQRGIVHRDLKPANIKITPSGVIKVLDFGLATTVATLHQENEPLQPTMAVERTTAGVVMGTAPYMSPEQARGLPLDKRTDIWAFGCVLYEMLSGRLAFAGATMSDTIAAILHRDPDWTAVPADTPPGIVRLMKRCLEKDPDRRLRDIGDADLALDAPATGEPAAQSAGWLPWIATAAAAVAVAGVALVGVRRRSDAPAPTASTLRFEIPATVHLTESGTFSVSPDGRTLIFGGSDAKGIFRLWIRSMDSLETIPVSGSDEPDVNFMPPVIWSPDGRSIAFNSGGKIKRLDRSGGLPRVVCDAPGVAVGGSWNAADVILVGNTAGGVMQCPAAGGTATPVTALVPSLKDASHMFPVFLPNGRQFIYLRASRIDPSESGIYLGDLAMPPDRQSTRRLVTTPFGADLVEGADGDGHLLFVRDGTLFAAPLDLSKGVVSGEPVIVANGLGTFRDGAFFSASSDTLVYRTASAEFQLTWLDRRGDVKGLLGEPAELGGAALSPDATRVATWRRNRAGRSSRELWLVDVTRNASTPFPTGPEADVPAWSADGKDLYFVLGTRGAGLYRQPVDRHRAAEVLRREGGADGPMFAGGAAMHATPDGRFVIFAVEGGATGLDLMILPVAGGLKAQPLVHQDFDQLDGRVASNGRWLAYVSNESGIFEVFVRPLTRDPFTGMPVPGPSMLVSSGGAMSPRWRQDGRELFYQSRGGSIMAVKVDDASVGPPTELFHAPPGIQSEWSVSRDGDRFLVAAPVQRTAPAFTVVANWQSSLTAR